MHPGLLLAAAVMIMPAGRAEDHKDHKTGLKASGAKSHEASFIEHAAQGGLMEVKMGQLAQQKGQSSEIKQFGQKLVQDHTKANAELMQIAQKKGITLEKTLDAKHQSHLDKLTAATGAEFDKAFAKDALKTHKKTIAKFEKAVTSEKDEDVKNFAQMLVTDHTKSLEELKTLARQKGMTWPADAQLAEHHATDKNADKEKAGWDRVTQAQGAEFDRMFLKNQIDHHKRNIKEFERTSRNHSDSDIRAFATKTLPTLQGHLQQAQALSKNKVNRDTTSGSNN
jgi:putative membrane protein